MERSDSSQAILIALHTDILFPDEAEHAGERALGAETAQRSYLLSEGVCKIGRRPDDTQIRVRSLDVSRDQAVITQRDGRYILEDSHSKYGTFVNGQQIHGPWELAPGDVIGFANHKEMLRFEQAGYRPTAPADSLSERELEVLSHLAVGRTNQEIADKLVITVETVRTHLRRIYDKLGVENRTQAVHEARRRRLI